MRSRHGLLILLMLGAFSLLLTNFIPCPSIACTCLLFPEGELYFLNPTKEIPQNAQGIFLWGNFSKDLSPEQLSGIKILDNAGRYFPTEQKLITGGIGKQIRLIRPQGGFQLGKSYTFTNVHGSRKTEVKVIAPVPKPGTSIVRLLKQPAYFGQVNVPMHCLRNERRAKLYPIKMELPEELEKYREHLYFETIIDGKIKWSYQDKFCSLPNPGASWRGKGLDEVFVFCDSVSPARMPLKPGPHTVQMQASLLGTDLKIATNTERLVIDCQ